MLTPDYYEHIADDLIDIYSALDDAIISVVAKRIAKFGDLSETSIWQLQQLSENGGVYDDVLKEIARRSNKSEQELRNIFKQAGLEATANDYHSVARTFSNKLSPSAIQMLNAGYRKCQGNLKNLTLTTANTSQSAYITACNNAYMQIVSGAFSYQTAIRDAIKSVAQTGTEVLYSSGRRDKLDVAVRRSVLTGVGQTVRTLSEMNAEDLECDLMEITAHAGARPSHAQWQGQLVSLSGRRGYLSKDDIGYGRGDGFGGWNCRHDWHPFFEGISKRAYSSSMLKQLNARDIEYKGKKYTEYEITQMQRKYERDIRSLKREAIAYDEAADSVEDEQLQAMLKQDFAEVSVKLKEKEKQLKQFVKDTGQLRDRFREQVYGFGRSTAQKAVWAERKALTGSQNSGKLNDINSNIEVSTKYHKGLLKYYTITSENINKIPYVDIEIFSKEQNEKLQENCKKLLKYMKDEPLGTEGAFILDMNCDVFDIKKSSNANCNVKIADYTGNHIVIHNHPDGLIFSYSDYKTFYNHQDLKVLGAIGNNGNLYFIEKTSEYSKGKLRAFIALTKMKYPKEMTPEQHLLFSEEILEGAEKYGVKFYRERN